MKKHKHFWKTINEDYVGFTNEDGDESHILKWCSLCGAIKTDKEIENGIFNLIPIKYPRFYKDGG